MCLWVVTDKEHVIWGSVQIKIEIQLEFGLRTDYCDGWLVTEDISPELHVIYNVRHIHVI